MIYFDRPTSDQGFTGLIEMHDDTENPFGSTIWSFLIFGAIAAALYLLGLKSVSYLVVILGSLVTVAVTASVIENDSAPITGRFSPATGKIFAVIGFVCKLAVMVLSLSAVMYGAYWAWTTESWRTMCGSLCY